MKHIEKGPSPSSLEEWKTAFKEKHKRSPSYNDLRGSLKKILKEALLNEQGALCCYCMDRIEDYNSHIEHFIPRAEGRHSPHSVRSQDVELNYDNLFLSCEGENWDQSHCGRHKGAEDTPMLLSPADERVATAFAYTVDGDIIGTIPEAMTSIRVLNLYSHELKRHRSTAIYYSGFFDEDYEENRDFLIHLFSSRDNDGNYLPFCEAVLYIMTHF